MSKPENNSSDHKPIPPEIQLEIKRLESKLTERINEKNLADYEKIIDIKTKAIENRFGDRFKDYRRYITKIVATAAFLLGSMGYLYINHGIDVKISEVIGELEPEKRIQKMMQAIDKLKLKAEKELQAKIEEIKNIGLEDITPEQKEIVKEVAAEIEEKSKEEYSAGDYFVRGVQAVTEDNFEDAIKYFQKAIQLNPDYAYAHNNLGAAYGNMGKDDQAIEAYKKAIQLKPDYAYAYYNLGNAYLNKDNYDQAIEAYKKAIQLKPDYADAYNNLGATYGKNDEYDQAIEALKKAIQLNPDFADAYYNLACFYSLKEDQANALKWLELSIDKGYDDLKHIEKTSELDFIRNTTEYKRIIQKLKDKL